jgi:hypothetical protein
LQCRENYTKIFVVWHSVQCCLQSKFVATEMREDYTKFFFVVSHSVQCCLQSRFIATERGEDYTKIFVVWHSV